MLAPVTFVEFSETRSADPRRTTDNECVVYPTTPLDASHADVLLLVYRLFATAGDWPTFDQIDYEVDRTQLGDAWDLLREMPRGLIGGSDLRTSPSATQQFHLTIAAMAAVAERLDTAATDFRVFCASVVIATQASDETRPPEAATISASDLPRLVDLPATDRSGVLTRVGRQWAVNGHLWSQFHGSGNSWSATLSRKSLRAYRGARDTASFLDAERRRLIHLAEDRLTAQPSPIRAHHFVDAVGATSNAGTEGSPVAPEPVTPTASADETHLPAWFTLLPADLASHLRSRVESGHPEDAFTYGWKKLAEALNAASGLHSDGADLVNKTLKTLDLTQMTDSEQNATIGYFDMMRGLVRVRNVQAHHGSAPFTELEQAAFLLTLGACVEWVSTLPAAPNQT